MVLLLAGAAAAQDGPTQAQTCVDVRIGSTQYYDCVNRALALLVPSERFSAANSTPLTATSPPNETGTFNQAATREQLGSAFGHSVVPQRPPPPVYSLPLPR
jgi:hypothetical protein